MSDQEEGVRKYDIFAKNEFCKKSRNDPDHHRKFIGVNDLREDHLPDLGQPNIMLELIKNMSTLTLRIAFKANGRYCYGSGHIVGTRESDQGMSKIVIRTANHVLRNMNEPKHVYIWLDYDSVESVVIEIQGITIKKTDLDNDTAEFECEVSPELINRVNSYLKFNRTRLNRYRMERDKNKMVALVSHPHGCCKYISIGEFVGEDDVVNRDDPLSYSTPSCPGSSGGYGMYFGSCVAFVHSSGTATGVGQSSGRTIDS